MTTTNNTDARISDFFITDLNDNLRKFGKFEYSFINDKTLTVKLAKKTTNVISKEVLKTVEAYTEKNYFLSADIEYNVTINIII